MTYFYDIWNWLFLKYLNISNKLIYNNKLKINEIEQITIIVNNCINIIVNNIIYINYKLLYSFLKIKFINLLCIILCIIL